MNKDQAAVSSGEQAQLVLADGTCFAGTAIGHRGTTVGEAVFNTAMTGYQEVLTDPSYCGQIVAMTAAHIGNTGINDEDGESQRPFLAGFVLRQMPAHRSNWRADCSLDAFLRQHGVVGIAGVDTRRLTRHLRDHGAQMAAIGTGNVASLREMAASAPPMTGQNLVAAVSTAKAYAWSTGRGPWAPRPRVHDADAGRNASDTPSSPAPNSAPQPQDGQRWRVVAIDFGIKRNILRCLVDAGCTVQVLPAQTSAAEVLALDPDGVFLSNGPGDPAAVSQGTETVRALLGQRPLFGICLGHQLLCQALGGETYKLKFGHHGNNQPVQDLHTRRVEITAQNHGFAVDIDSLAGKCDLTHVNLNDGTCEGIAHRESNAFGVQYHPEAAAGPHDAHYLFARFVDRMRAFRR